MSIYGKNNLKRILDSLLKIKNNKTKLNDFLRGVTTGNNDIIELVISTKEYNPHGLFMYLYDEGFEHLDKCF